MKVLICPDKFKGTLSASEVAQHIEKGCLLAYPNADIEMLPLADGGEGTLELLRSILPLSEQKVSVKDPLFREIDAIYYTHKNSAYIEMASASGLPLLKLEERNCMQTTTYGTGQLIAHAIKGGAKEVYLFIGGSATNDAGIGMAEALGFRFYNKDGNLLKSIGKSLIEIADYKRVDNSLDLSGVSFYVVTDVKNAFYGAEGAAYVYASQKGASSTEVEILDRGLENFCQLVRKKTGQNLQAIEGAGAAGGLGGGGKVFLDAELLPGIETILKLVHFDTKLSGVDLVITGEGKFDKQTLHGKVVQGVYEKCRAHGIPVAVVCGVLDVPVNIVDELGFKAVMPLVAGETTVDEALKIPGKLIEKRVSTMLAS